MTTWPKRFADKVCVDGPDQCWLWVAGTSEGYGHFSLNGRMASAHRLAWQWHTGREIPPGTLVCHACDVRRCVNPAHLFLGTPALNSADMVAKSRQACGVRNGRAKLTTEQVAAVLTDARSCRQIAAEYGVYNTTISKIRTGENWRDLRALHKEEAL